MYEAIKRIAKSLLPASVLREQEDSLRKLATLRYRGNTYQCNCCGTKLRSFVKLNRGDDLCPRCGSLPRTRRLWHILNEELDITGLEVLHFSPPKILDELIRKAGTKDYTSTDYEGEFQADEQFDITDIPQPDTCYDLVICYHVLEHVPDDRAAIAELYRILKPGGLCLIQTPFKEGEIFEDETITSPNDRLRAFGQADHVRVYSVEGLTQRLRAAGFRVAAITYPPNHLHSWRGGETVLYCERRE